MALTANQEVDRLVDQELRQYGLTASAHVFKGGFVGLAIDGFARAFVAGDLFLGLAYEEGDNTSGADGDGGRAYLGLLQDSILLSNNDGIVTRESVITACDTL